MDQECTPSTQQEEITFGRSAKAAMMTQVDKFKSLRCDGAQCVREAASFIPCQKPSEGIRVAHKLLGIIRDVSRFMGNLGRDNRQGGKHFFGEEKKGARTFFCHKKRG